MSEEIAHEAVVSSLLDLQARLRGDLAAEPPASAGIITDTGAPEDVVRVPEAEATPVFVNLPDGDITPTVGSMADPVAVIEDDLVVEVAAEDRLMETLSDDDDGYFAPVTPLHPVDPTSSEGRLAALTERLARLEGDLDGVMTRIEKVDPARIDRLEAVHDELGAQSEGLKAQIESHFTELQRSIDERLRSTDA